MKRGRPGTGTDAHAILSDAVQIDQTSPTQHLHRLCEQLLQELRVVRAEIRERVVVDGDATGEPAEGIVTEAQIGELPSAAEAGEGGIQPQCDEQARIDGRPPGHAAACANAVIQRGEVQPLDVRPDGASGVVRFQEFIDGHGRKELLAIRGVQARSGVAIRIGARRGYGSGTGGANSRGLSGRRRVRAFERSGDLRCALLGVLL